MDFADMLPPGFRFYPADEELIRHYLQKKVAGIPIRRRIGEKDVYGEDMPWEIFRSVHEENHDEENADVYVFSLSKKKYPTGNKSDRKIAGGGLWKMTGKGQKIKEIGRKDTFNYKEDGAGGRNQTGWNWIMHEFTLITYPQGCKRWALCRIKKGRRATEDESVASSSSSSKRPMDQIIDNAHDPQNYYLDFKKSAKISGSMYTSQASTSRPCHESLQAYQNFHVPLASTSYCGAPQQMFLGSMRYASEASTSRSFEEQLQVHENIHHAVPQAYLSYRGAPQPKPQAVNQACHYAAVDKSQQLSEASAGDATTTCDSETASNQPTHSAQPQREEDISTTKSSSIPQTNDQTNLSQDTCQAQSENQCLSNDDDMPDILSMLGDWDEFDFNPDIFLQGVDDEDLGDDQIWDAESLKDLQF